MQFKVKVRIRIQNTYPDHYRYGLTRPFQICFCIQNPDPVLQNHSNVNNLKENVSLGSWIYIRIQSNHDSLNFWNPDAELHFILDPDL